MLLKCKICGSMLHAHYGELPKKEIIELHCGKCDKRYPYEV